MGWKFTINGVVQGVGFRPNVKQLADELGINGRVYNSESGVIIEFAAEQQLAAMFEERIRDHDWNNARIESIVVSRSHLVAFESGFVIDKTIAAGSVNLRLTPDFQLCESCIIDLSEHPRRKDYAFTTCTQCGPRFAIANGFPFDREQLSVSDFEMCPECLKEYLDETDRRFHSQTNSCNECGPKIFGWPLINDGLDAIEQALEHLHNGKIVAVQTVTGFLLLADATNEAAITFLREKKKRPSKPLAVLYKDLESVKTHFKLDQGQAKALSSSVGPIVLLRRIKETKSLPLIIAPGLREIGVMLPSNPLLYLLSSRFEKPLIATSGNRGGSPIIDNFGDAKRLLADIVSFYLYHNLGIVHPMDDSVVKVANDRQIVIRPSRGLTPNYFGRATVGQETIVAFGADLKAHYALFHNGKCYVSPYFGNLENFDVQERMRFSIDHLFRILNVTPKTLLIDGHPGYHSRVIAEEYSNKLSVPLREVPHHEAHFCSVLADYDLFHIDEEVLGIVYDGVGYIKENKLGGAEIFVFEDDRISSIEGFEWYPIISGEQMSVQTRLALLSIYPESSITEELFNESELRIYSKVREMSKGRYRSMGRLFDAVAALLRVSSRNTYEGESAMKLEAMGTAFLESNTDYRPVLLDIDFSLKSYLISLELHLAKGRIVEELVVDFIATLANQIIALAQQKRIKHVACSGGVFQNTLLIDFLIEFANKVQINLYFNRESSPNDSGISIGQLYHSKNIK